MNIRNHGHALNTFAPNLSSEELRTDLAALGTRFRRELNPMFGAAPDALLDAVIAWLERAKDLDPEVVTAQSLLAFTDTLVALRNSRLLFIPRQIGGSVVIELAGERGGAVAVDALRYDLRVAVARYDPVLGETLAQRADATHRRHIAEMTAMFAA